MSFQALVLVDIQNDYFAGGSMELVGMGQAAKNAAKILDYARDENIRIFHIQHIATSNAATFFLPETKGVEHHQSVSQAV